MRHPASCLLWLILLLPALPIGCPADDDDVSDDDTGQDDDASDDDTAGDDDGGDDDGGDDDGGDDDTAPHSYECVEIGAAGPDGFFALRDFQGTLYAGMFGYGLEGQSMIYAYPPWALVQPGLTGVSESVCALREWNGRLYANTESSADIVRSADGATWERVYDGPDHTIGCGLEVFGGLLYAVNYDNGDQEEGQILRTSNGTDWTVVWSSGGASWYVREIASHDGVLHVFAVDEATGQGYRISSTNGTDWTTHETPSRFFRAHSWNGSLWIGSTDYSSNGVAGVWQSDGENHTLVHTADKHYVTELVDWDGALWAGTSDGWKHDPGFATLLRSDDGGDWETICDFPELAVWSIAVSGANLYVGTWEYQVGGHVFEVRIVDDPGDDDAGDDDTSGPVDCSLISSANPSWEVCEFGADYCNGVYGDGAGCQAYCAAAGLVCHARFGGEPGCNKEPNKPIDCFADNGHQSDWCDCGP